MPAHELLYLIYGKPTPFLEGRYSILSAFAASQVKPPRITVITDRPEAFAGFPVTTLPLTPTRRAAWVGPANYIHRSKICAVEWRLDACEKLALIDADTIFLQSPHRLFERISPGHSLMHRDEGGMFLAPDQTHIAAPLRRDFPDMRIPSLDGLTLALHTGPEGPHIWNSGVIGLHTHDRHLLPHVLHLSDMLLPLTQAHTVEQVAFAMVLSTQTRLQPAEDLVEHYWPIMPYPSRPQWKNQRTMYHHQAQRFFDAHPHASFSELLRAYQRHPARLFRITPRIRLMTAIHRRADRQPRPIQFLLRTVGL